MAQSGEISGCDFVDNGLGVKNFATPTTISNAIFTGNRLAVEATGEGTTTVNNSTLYENTDGIKVFYNSGEDGPHAYLEVHNTIIWGADPIVLGTNGEATVTYSNIEGDFTGKGNHGYDPRFIDAEALDLHLDGCSPNIDKGDDVSAPITDKDGVARVDDPEAVFCLIISWVMTRFYGGCARPRCRMSAF